MESWGLKFSGIGHFDIICGRWRGGQNLKGKGVHIQKYWMIWHGITLSLSLLSYYCIYVNFMFYFENKEKFCSCVWLQICSTFWYLIYCSFGGFCDLILFALLGGGGFGGSPPHHQKSIPPRTHTNTQTHRQTHTITLNNKFQVTVDSLWFELSGGIWIWSNYGEFGLGEVGHFWNILATETGITGQSKGLGVGVQKDKYVRHISLYFSFLK